MLHCYLTYQTGSPIVHGKGNGAVEVTFGDSDLGDLESNPDFRSTFSPQVVRAYRRLIRYIRDATDERDLRAYSGKHFEKLKGDRGHQCSMQINDKLRLVFEISKGNPKNIIHVVEIVDYHKG